MNRPYSEDECNVLITYWNRGETAKQIARRLPGRSVWSISDRAAKLGLQLRVAGVARSWFDDRVKLLIEGCEAGIPAQVISEQLGVSRAAVLNKGHRLGLSLKHARSA